MYLEKIKNRVFYILDFIFPIECINCQKNGKWLCTKCFEKLSFYQDKYCPICKKESKQGKFCKDCSPLFIIDKIFIAGSYKNKIISELIKKLKFYSIKDISQILGDYLYKFLKKEKILEKNGPYKIDIKKTIIIPVPLSRRRYNFRGFNQSEEIAKRLSEKTKIPLQKNLKKIKNTKAQSKLSREKRLKNLQNCFMWSGKSLNKKNIILIDDVITTGSTLNECAKELKKHGAGKVWGLVVAKG